MRQFYRKLFLVAMVLTTCLLSGVDNHANAQFTNFVTASNGKLYDGAQELRWCSVNIPFVDYTEDGEGGTWKELTPWEQEDLVKTVVQMGSKVIRRYAFSTRQPGKTYAAHVQGPGQFNEAAFVAFDRFLALCNQYNIRIIVPFVDQYNYNWVGGVYSYQAFRGLPTNDDGSAFVNNAQVRADFKATINYVLNRVNTVTGVKYKDDKAILAWETGNELWCENKNYAWVYDISAYIKSIDSNHLLIDGDMEPSVANRPAMLDPNIDIVSNHYYKWSNGHTNLVAAVQADMAITSGVKPFIIGEHGLTNYTDIHNMLDASVTAGVSGVMLWSLRGHREAGGFWQHQEGNWIGDGVDYWAYHWPGFPINDNYGETAIIQDVYQHAYSINGQTAPTIPIPQPPVLLPISNPTQAINWKGSVGGKNYDIQRSLDNTSWTTIASNVYDMYKSYSYPANYKDLSASASGYYYRVIAKNTSGSSAPSNVVLWGTPPIVVPVTGVSVSPTTTSVQIGATKQLSATISPANATNTNLTWNSSNTSVATVNGYGLVTGVGTGTATITVKTQDGNKTATSTITVTAVPVTGATLNNTSLQLFSGGSTSQLIATVNPSNATNKNVTWSSSNTSVATVNSNGVVTPIAAGSATITVTTQDGNKTANCAVSVTGSVPSPWSTSDIGNVGATGSAGYSSGSFTLAGSGYDIEENDDEFRFVYQQKTGDVTIIARMVSIQNTNPWAKAGVMIRESLNSNSKMSFIPITAANGTFFQNRTTTNGISQESTIVSGIASPYWMKLVRAGNTFTSYISSNGTSWTQQGTSTISMAQNAYIGLGVTSHNDGVLCTAVFDNVSIVSGSTPPSGGDGVVTREYWTGITGTTVSLIPTNTSPSGTSTLTNLECPLNWADNYGTRIRGYIVPSTTGNYTFFMAGDDNCELWLSNNNSPANITKIAQVIGWTSNKQWTKYSSQQSASTYLVAGNFYYFQALHKEGAGGDNLAIGWTTPGSSSISVIGSSNISSYTATNVSVTGISVSPTSASITTTSTQQLNATITPSNATNKAISWSSSNSSIASVNSSGLVTGLTAGSTTITATSQDGGYTATSNVTVTGGAPSSVTIENFETYSGSTSNLQSAYVSNSSGNTVTVSLSTSMKSEGSYGMQYQYTVGTPNYAGKTHSITNGNWSGKNAISLWLKPDGSNRSLTFQIKESSGEYWEYNQTLSGTSASTLTIGFNSFNHPGWYSGGNGIIDGTITEFNIYVNQNSGGSGTGTLYFDDIKAIYNGGAGARTGHAQEEPVNLQEELTIRFYPNPLNDLLNIDFGKEGHYQLAIYDMIGKIVYHNEIINSNTSINTSNFNKGVYLIKVIGSKQSITSTLIKQ